METEYDLERVFMAKITREEVLKLAKLSHIKIHDNEIDSIIHQLEQVLSYAARVQEVATDVNTRLPKNINVMRVDEVIKTDSDRILSRAPDAQEHLFVVPAILENPK